MIEYMVHTYEDAKAVMKEVGFLPLAPLIPSYPSLDSITAKEQWHTGSEFDPWLWRAMFPVDGIAAYGKFVKKKSVLISRDLLPLVRVVLGAKESIRERYEAGLVSREALELFTIIGEDEGIDTRLLRVKAGMKDKDKKKAFDNGLLELQGSMDILVSGTKAKTNDLGEKNGWSSTSYETMEYWNEKQQIDPIFLSKAEGKMELKNHFSRFCRPEALKGFEKIFKF